MPYINSITSHNKRGGANKLFSLKKMYSRKSELTGSKPHTFMNF